MGGRTSGKSNSFSISGMGSIEKLDRNRWRIRVSLGKDPVTGKYRRSPSITVHGTKSDAINELTQYRTRLQSGDEPFLSGTIPTVGEYARRFHELRHTQATLLIGNGADIKTVQHRLGHSSASLTMNIYAHAIEQNDREAADAISGILSRKTE